MKNRDHSIKIGFNGTDYSGQCVQRFQNGTGICSFKCCVGYPTNYAGEAFLANYYSHSQDGGGGGGGYGNSNGGGGGGAGSAWVNAYLDANHFGYNVNAASVSYAYNFPNSNGTITIQIGINSSNDPRLQGLRINNSPNPIQITIRIPASQEAQYVIDDPMLSQNYSSVHPAVDVINANGNSLGQNLRALEAGIVVRNVTKPDGDPGGVRIRVQTSAGYCYMYCHMIPGSNSGYSVGDNVNAGDILGQLGNTGTSSGPHVHIEIWNTNTQVHTWQDPTIIYPNLQIRR
jgi:murein DD-endopeptidase MepM/ murein hydrolase activator NlpD